MFTNGFYWSRVALVCNFGGFVSFLAGFFGFILAGTDIRGIMMDNFGRQKFNSEIRWMDNFVPHTDRHKDRHTDTLLIFISIDELMPKLTVSSALGLILLNELCHFLVKITLA